MEQSNPAEFEKFCRTVVFAGVEHFRVAGGEYPYVREWQLKHCKATVSKRYDVAHTNYMDSLLISLPGGMGRLHVSDLGIMGNLGLLLIFAWLYFALRRENHAVKSFVDFDRATARQAVAPKKFILEPQDENFSAEHYAFAYQAISQRFVFIFSSYSKPLLIVIGALMLLPAATCALNLFTDIRDLARTPDLFEPIVYVRFALQLVLVCAVFLANAAIVVVATNTSVLLNGWHLAVRDVWMDEWNESNNDPACSVLVNRGEQKAERAGAD